MYKKIDINNKFYSNLLRSISNPPKILYAKGNLTLLNETCISIIGSRSCSDVGINNTKIFSNFLANSNICIVSGMALGIDTIAHTETLKISGKTIAVLGSGFNYIYPQENIKLFNNIIENNGLVISEYSPNTKPDSSYFPKRNRIVSGLSIATLVIEAAYRSGTSITAKLAKTQNRTVFAIPGSITNTHSVGTNKLIQKGAILVTKPEEILNKLNISSTITTQTNIFDNTNFIAPEFKPVYNIIKDTPININEIYQKVSLSTHEINSILTLLELDGYILKLPGNEVKLS